MHVWSLYKQRKSLEMEPGDKVYVDEGPEPFEHQTIFLFTKLASAAKLMSKLYLLIAKISTISHIFLYNSHQFPIRWKYTMTKFSACEIAG